MFKKIHSLTFKDGRFYIHIEKRIFGILVLKEKIASFADIELAVKFIKTIK
jgi:hypothetical protein